MTMTERFISEPIAPVKGAMDTQSMATGEPGLPRKFTWRGEKYTVAQVLEKWKENGSCKSGGSERYVRKHWFKVRTTSGALMKLYCERHARSKRQQKIRWWLFTIERESEKHP